MNDIIWAKKCSLEPYYLFKQFWCFIKLQCLCIFPLTKYILEFCSKSLKHRRILIFCKINRIFFSMYYWQYSNCQYSRQHGFSRMTGSVTFKNVEICLEIPFLSNDFFFSLQFFIKSQLNVYCLIVNFTSNLEYVWNIKL